MFELMDNNNQSAVIKVIGVGGGGGNAVEYMIRQGLDGVDFICANTDAQALERLSCRNVIQIGTHITKGLAAGANPEIGRQAAMEDRDRIEEVLNGADMVFIAAGMGGGTGTGGAPIVAQIAKELGILTVAVVTKPFPFEGKRRMDITDQGIEELKKYADSVIIIPAHKIFSTESKQINLLDAFRAVNGAMLDAVQGISDLITRPGLINVDLADVRNVLSKMGLAMIGNGVAKGEGRALEAAKSAAHSPLFDDISLSSARGILVNITFGLDSTIGEVEEVGNTIKEFASQKSTVVIGTVIDPELSDEVHVTVIAAGLDGGDKDGSRPTVTKNISEGGEVNVNVLDIPELLKRQADGTHDGFESSFLTVKLVADESTPDEELAELIVHLSNVYRSIGGDELIVQAVGNTPPGSGSYKKIPASPVRRAAR